MCCSVYTKSMSSPRSQDFRRSVLRTMDIFVQQMERIIVPIIFPSFSASHRLAGTQVSKSPAAGTEASSDGKKSRIPNRPRKYWMKCRCPTRNTDAMGLSSCQNAFPYRNSVREVCTSRARFRVQRRRCLSSLLNLDSKPVHTCILEYQDIFFG